MEFCPFVKKSFWWTLALKLSAYVSLKCDNLSLRSEQTWADGKKVVLFLACAVLAQHLWWWWGALLPLIDFTSDIIWLKFSNYHYCTHYTHLSDILNFALSHQVGFLPSHSFVIFSRYSPRLMLINLGTKINNPLIKYSSSNNSLGRCHVWVIMYSHHFEKNIVHSVIYRNIKLSPEYLEMSVYLVTRKKRYECMLQNAITVVKFIRCFYLLAAI